MSRISIIQPEQSCTFSDYFKLNFAPQDILAYFGVSLQRRFLQLPQYAGTLADLNKYLGTSIFDLNILGIDFILYILLCYFQCFT